LGKKRKEVGKGSPGISRAAIRCLAIAALLVTVFAEGYYIMALRDTIKKQTEDLRDISVQIQILNSEHERLIEEISATEKKAGEKDNGSAAQR
jgi:hypothetical protein